MRAHIIFFRIAITFLIPQEKLTKHYPQMADVGNNQSQYSSQDEIGLHQEAF
jgi:hypothetical protein